MKCLNFFRFALGLSCTCSFAIIRMAFLVNPFFPRNSNTADTNAAALCVLTELRISCSDLFMMHVLLNLETIFDAPRVIWCIVDSSQVLSPASTWVRFIRTFTLKVILKIECGHTHAARQDLLA